MGGARGDTQPASAQQCRDALAVASEVGPYLAVQTSGLRDGSWRPLRDLLRDVPLDERVGSALAYLERLTGGPVERRACASVQSLGVVARLVSPPLASAVLGGVVPAMELDRTGWRDVTGGPLPLCWEPAGGRRVDSAHAAADALDELVLGPVVRPLLARYGERFPLSPRVLQGNLASALAGAAGMLLRAHGRQRLDPVAVVEALLGSDRLSGSGGYDEQRRFVRTSCCLYYRVPGGDTCGDCVLAPDAARQARWRSAARQPS